MKKLLIGIVFSIVFIYFSVQGIVYKDLFYGLDKARFSFLLPTVILILLVSLLRSLRFGVILSSIETVSQRILFPINCIGFMAISLVPMRIGELVRPYLVSRNTEIPLSSALASIFIERVLDALILLSMMLIVIFNSSLPGWILKSGYGMLFTFLVLLALVFFLYFRTENALQFLSPLLGRLPVKLRTRIESLALTFSGGFKILGNPGRLFSALCLTILIWGSLGLATYSLILFYNLPLPFIGAFAVLLITVIGISIPTAPGFLGNFQFSCMMALSVFHVARPSAFAFSMSYYFVVVVMNILLGMVFLPFQKFSIGEMRKVFKRGLETQGSQSGQ